MTEAQQLLPGIPWFNIPDPNSGARDELAKRFHLHPLQIEDCRHRPQRAKTDEYGEYIFSILKHVERAGDELDFDDLDIFLGKDFLITVQRQDCAVIRKSQQVAQQNQITRVDQLFYRLVDATVDDYVSVLDQIREQASDMESGLLKNPDPPTLRDIFHMKFHMRHKLIKCQHGAADMRDVVNTLIRRERGLLRSLVTHRRHDRKLSRPASRNTRFLSRRSSQPHQRGHEVPHHLGDSVVATRDHHRLLWDESSPALGKPRGQHYLCRWLDGGIYCASAAVFET